MSTDDASSPRTRRRLCRPRSESVATFTPASTLREHAGTSTREPSSSTTQTRQTLTGVRFSSWQRVGVSTCSRRHASRMVEPSVTSISRPSIVMPTSRFGIPTKTVSAIEDLQLRQSRTDRVGRGLPETADRCVAHRLRDVAQQHDVRAAIAFWRGQEPFQDLLLAFRADAARDALTARLIAEEARDAQQDAFHVSGVVEHEPRARTPGCANGPRPLEAERNVKLRWGDEGARRPAEQDCLERSPRPYTAGVSVQKLAQGCGHRDPVEARLQDLTRHAEQT